MAKAVLRPERADRGGKTRSGSALLNVLAEPDAAGRAEGPRSPRPSSFALSMTSSSSSAALLAPKPPPALPRRVSAAGAGRRISAVGRTRSGSWLPTPVPSAGRFAASCAVVLLAPSLVSALLWIVPYGQIWPPARWSVTFLVALTMYFPCGILTCWWLNTYAVLPFCVAAYTLLVVPLFLLIGQIPGVINFRGAFVPYICTWFAVVGLVSRGAPSFLSFLERRAARWGRPPPAPIRPSHVDRLGYWSFVLRMSLVSILVLCCPGYVLLFAAFRRNGVAQTVLNVVFNTFVLIFGLLWAFVAWRPLQAVLPRGDISVLLLSYVAFANKLFKQAAFFRVHDTTTYAAMLATELVALCVPASLVYRRLRFAAAAALRRLVPDEEDEEEEEEGEGERGDEDGYRPAPPSAGGGVRVAPDPGPAPVVIVPLAEPAPESMRRGAGRRPSGSAGRRWSLSGAAGAVGSPEEAEAMLGGREDGEEGEGGEERDQQARSRSMGIQPAPLAGAGQGAGAGAGPEPEAAPPASDPALSPASRSSRPGRPQPPAPASFRAGPGRSLRGHLRGLLAQVTEEEAKGVRDGVPSFFLVNALVTLSSSLATVTAVCAGRWGPASDVAPFGPSVLSDADFRSTLAFCGASCVAVGAVAAAAGAAALFSRTLRESLFGVGRRFVAERGWLLAALFVNAPIFPFMVLIKPNKIFSSAYPEAYP
eukprot:tig00021728_g23308.t1